MDRATIRQKKTGRPVRFELTDQTRLAIDEYLRLTERKPGQLLFAGRRDGPGGLTTRQYARLVREWVASIGLDPAKFGTHSLRVLIYRRTGNLRAVQLLLGQRRSRAPFGISASRSMTLSRSPRRSISEPTQYTRQRTWSAVLSAPPIADGSKSAYGMLCRCPPDGPLPLAPERADQTNASVPMSASVWALPNGQRQGSATRSLRLIALPGRELMAAVPLVWFSAIVAAHTTRFEGLRCQRPGPDFTTPFRCTLSH